MDAIYEDIENLIILCREMDNRIRQIHNGENVKNAILDLLRLNNISPNMAQEILEYIIKTYQLEHAYNQSLR